MKRTRRTGKTALPLIGAALAVALAISGAQAVTIPAGSILGINPDPQSIALGDSILSLSDSPSSMIVNPAATKVLYRPRISYIDSVFDGSTRYRFVGTGIPVRSGLLGIGLAFAEYKDLTGVSPEGVPYSRATVGDMAVVFNYSHAFTRETPLTEEVGSMGVNVKILHSNVLDWSSDALAIDAGGIVAVPFVRGLSAAASMRNLGSALNFDTITAELPTSAALGLRYDREEWKNFALVGGYAVGRDSSAASLGLSIAPVFPFVLRGGIVSVTGEISPQYRFGLGADFGEVSVQYAAVQAANAGAVHHVGVEISLGNFLQPKVAYEHYLKYYFIRARDRYDRRDYIGARSLFEDILSIYPEHQASKEYLMKIIAALDKIEQQKDEEVKRLLRKARVSITKFNIFQARRYYKHVLRLDPENIEAIEGQNHIDELLVKMQKEKSYRVNEARLNTLWKNAIALYRHRDFVQAKEKFEDMLAIYPDSTEAKRYIDDINGQLGKFSEVQIENIYNRGVELYGKGDYREAHRQFVAVTVAAPNHESAQNYVRACEAKLQQAEVMDKEKAAEAEQSRMLGEIEKVFDHGVERYNRGDYEQATKDFGRVRSLSTRYGYSKYMDSSREYLVQMRTAMSEKYYASGNAFQRAGKLEQSVEEYRRALDVNPDYADAKKQIQKVSDTLAQQFYDLGMKEFSNGELERASDLFRKSLKFKPDKVEAQRALERCQQ